MLTLRNHLKIGIRMNQEVTTTLNPGSSRTKMKLLLLQIIAGFCCLTDGQSTTGRNECPIDEVAANTRKLVSEVRSQKKEIVRLVIEALEENFLLLNRPKLGARLVGGHSRLGRFEVEYRGQWGTVCADGFTNNEARVACKQLGFWSGKVVQPSLFGRGHVDFIVGNIDCNGDEDDIWDCDHSFWRNPNCQGNNAVGLSCYYGPLGADVHYMETVPSDSRGTLYLGFISLNDTAVTDKSCGDLLRDLSGGYADSDALLRAGGDFGCFLSREGRNDPQRTDACQPSHQQNIRLSECTDCSHLFVCVEYPDTKGLLLVDGQQPRSGRLMVLNYGLWGTVCWDGHFQYEDAIVACRTLGYKTGKQAYSPTVNTHEMYSLWRVQCSGEEAELRDCTTNGWLSATCAYNVLIACANNSCGSRLHQISGEDSSTLANGFDFLCYTSRSDNSHLGMSCSDLLHELEGFSDSAALIAGGGRFGCYKAMNGLNDPQRMTACQAGRETSEALSDCASCTHMFVCVDYPAARLVGGSSSRRTLEIFNQGVWGGVGFLWFNDTDAAVACRTLGYQSGTYPGYVRREGFDGFAWMNYVQCAGSETNIFECGHSHVGQWYTHQAQLTCG